MKSRNRTAPTATIARTCARSHRCAWTVTRTSPPMCAIIAAITGEWPMRAPANAAPVTPNTRVARPTSCSSIAAHFDHHLTDFALEGAHSALECGGCHKTGQAWRKAPATCGGCHKADDVHRGQFTKSCGECHSAMSWSGRQIRSRQDRLQADGRPRRAHLRCLPRRRPLQADAENLRRLSRHRR